MQDGIKIIQDALDSNRTLKDVFPLIEKICVDVMKKKFDSVTYMCPGLIYSYGPVVSRRWAVSQLERKLEVRWHFKFGNY
jgi:hypothetical protein